MSNDGEKKMLQIYENIRDRVPFTPKVALVLGSGLGAFAEEIRVESTLDYRDIEGFPNPTAPGHVGRFVFGYVEDVPVVVMQGRIHYYEGYSMQDVVLPTRLMHLMGAEILFLTNAGGGLNETFSAGDLMLIRDQVALFVPSPLIGPNYESLGTRFPDTGKIYDRELQQILRDAAAKNGVKLQEGVYVQLTGPQYENPTEVKICRMLGGDAVGMSTACEAIAAVHCGMRVCGVTCISNLASGMGEAPLTHEEVQEVADATAPRFRALLWESIRNM